ncbi:hypothetical protein WBP07_31860 [Novosphingobium sp. BL-8A]|uniref:hypothetical protein n=1 Tax=Novosphingobium sp. BL-8A TaxID=3127639 RepID=UPI0037581B1C
MLLFAFALLASATPSPASSDEVDRKLAAFFYKARGGWVLHPLTHYVCADGERARQNREIFREYRRLEQRYLEMDGKFAPDSEQEISLEPYHSNCPQEAEERYLSAQTWEEIANSAETELADVRKLLDLKRRNLRQGAGHSNGQAI